MKKIICVSFLFLTFSASAAFYASHVQAEIYVVNWNNSITVYNDADTDIGNIKPQRKIFGSDTGLKDPRGISADAGYIYVTNYAGNSITVYNLADTGNVKPQRVISGEDTGLDGPSGISVDTGYMYVANFNSNNNNKSITVYNLTDTGNVKPQRVISGTDNGLNDPRGISADAGYIYVTNYAGNSITVYNLMDTDNVKPQRVISGTDTGLNGPAGISIDKNYIYVANYGSNSITVYNLADTGNVKPQRVISGTNTGLRDTIGIFTDTGYIYVTNYFLSFITIYNIAASGNVSPTRYISGTSTIDNTGLNFPYFICKFGTSVGAGNINGDNRIDLADAILGLRIIAGISVTETINLNADINGDKKIGIEEVIYILQKIAELR